MPDVYRNMKFEVEIDGFVRAGFAKVTGLKETTDVLEYNEGGDNESPRKLSGQTKYPDVTFERGSFTDSDIIDWRKQVFNVDEAEGNQGDENFRRTVTIYLKDKSGRRVKKWTLNRAWPIEKGSPDLDASGSAVAFESMILCHEGLKEETL